MRSFASLVIGTAVIALASPTFAQDVANQEDVRASDEAPQSAGDIIVTARRRDESIQEVPVAVSFVSGEALNKASVVNVQDITRLAPSISIGGGARGGSIPFLSIRGLSAADNSAATDPTIGIYIDEVIQNRPNGVLTSLYDIASVQVLRGPQGTLFGRNTIGGALLITSNAPTDRLEGYVRGRYGNFDYYSGEGMLNLPLTEWAKLRVAGRIDRRDGYVKSVTTGQDFSDLHNEGVRVSLLLEQGDVTSTTIGSYFNSNTNGTAATTPGLFPVGARTGGVTINPLGNVGDAGNRAAIAAAGALRQANFYRNAANEVQYERTKTYTLTNTTTLQASDSIRLKNIISYRHVRSANLFDSDGSAARQVVNEVEGKFSQFTEELQLSGEFGPASVILGAYYFEESGTEFSTTTGLIPLASINNPAASGRNGGFIRNKSYSGFASLGYKISDQLTLNGGFRYTVDKRFVDLRSGNILNPLSNPVFACTIGTVTSITRGPGPTGGDVDIYTVMPASPCSLKRSATFKEPSWSVDLNWKPTEDILLYVAHRHGYHSGALNSRAVFFIEADIAKPEFLDDIEVGLKSSFNLAGVPMRFNVAGYYGWFEDVQRTISLPTVLLNGVPRTINTLQNASQAHIAGVEIEYYATLFRGFNLSVFAAYNKTKYDSYIDNTTSPPTDRRNDLFPFAPKFTAGATARYEFAIGETSDAAVQLNYFHSSSMNAVTNLQPVYSVLPAYDLVNARVEANNLGGTGLDAALFVNNLTKEKYFTGATVVPAFGAAVQIVGAPRMYGVELTYRFGR